MDSTASPCFWNSFGLRPGAPTLLGDFFYNRVPHIVLANSREGGAHRVEEGHTFYTITDFASLTEAAMRFGRCWGGLTTGVVSFTKATMRLGVRFYDLQELFAVQKIVEPRRKAFPITV